MADPKPKLALLTNIVAPYRVPLYEALGEEFDVQILYSGMESNRAAWRGVTDTLVRCHAKRSWGVSLRRKIRADGRAWDYNFKHFNFGYWWDLRTYRPDAVISTELGFRTMLALRYALSRGKPMWVWWGGTLHTERKVPDWQTRMRRRMAARVPRWISYGDTSTEYLLSLGVTEDRVLQIQNCVDESVYERDAAPTLTNLRKPVLLHVGQLIARKGLLPLLEAAAEVQASGKSFSLVLLGDGPDKTVLQEKARALALKDVRFEPARPPAEMPGAYRSADCLVFPTLQDVWGLVANEAMWCGLPVLGSVYAGSSAELLPPESRFDPLNHDDFVRKLSQAVDGNLPSPDRSRLRPLRDVADALSEDIKVSLGYALGKEGPATQPSHAQP